MPPFVRGQEPHSLKTAKSTIKLSPGTAQPPHYKECIFPGENFHLEDRVNKRGPGKGMVPVTDHWDRLIGYVSVDLAEQVREEM